MRIFFANDTSNQLHWGCSATANGLRNFFYQNDIEVAHALGVKELNAAAFADVDAFLRSTQEARILKSCDILIVNGEGSLHSSRTPELEMLIEAAIHLRVPFAVVNACVRDYPRMIALLHKAAFVTVRDSVSKAYLRSAGIPAERSADACVYGSFRGAGAYGGVHAVDFAITDWHPQATAGLEPVIRAAHAGRGVFLPFKRLDAYASWPSAVHTLSQYGRVLCGRYHGAVFSILAGRDVALLRSNTDKIQTFAIDYGLTSRLAGDQDPESLFDIRYDDALRSAHDQLRAEAADRSMHPLHPLTSHRGLASRRASTPVHRRQEAAAGDRALVSKTEVMKARRLADRVAAMEASGVPDVVSEAEILLRPLGRFGHRVFAALAAQEAIPAACHASARYHERTGEIERAFELYGIANHAAANRFLLHQSALWLQSETPDVSLSATRGGDTDANREHQRSLAADAEASDLIDLAIRTRMDVFRLTRSLPDLQAAARIAYNHGKPSAAADIIRLYQGKKLDMADLTPAIGLLHYMVGDRAFGLDLLSRHRTARRRGKTVDRPTPADRDRIADCIAGKRIGLVFDKEGGIGNAVWGFGFAHMLSACVESMEIKTDQRLHGLIRRCLPMARIHAGAERFSDEVDVILDRHEVLLAYFSLVRKPRVPAFFSAEAALTSELRDRYRSHFGDRPLIGVAWFTSNPNSGWRRSIDLSTLLRSIDPEGRCGFVSLQYDDGRVDGDISRLRPPARMFRDENIDVIRDIDLHYAQIAAMDAIVTIDCSVVHFAGSLGKPTAMLTSLAPAWKWYAAEEAGVLHENLSLFHQSPTGSWAQTFQDVRRWLGSLISQQGPGHGWLSGANGSLGMSS